MTIFHGSVTKIENPLFGFGKTTNDYGLGFYCTQNLELAKEWSCTEEQNGFANEYDLNINGLSVLDLNEKYNILHWLAILLENRTFEIRREIAEEGKAYILKNFLPEYKTFDIIKGYRADDSYFSFANAFLNNTISLQKLNYAMKLGKLGEQIVLKSKQSFEQIKFINIHEAPKEIYYPKKTERDLKARTDFYNINKNPNNNFSTSLKDEIFLIDLIRQETNINDARLRQVLSI